MELIKKSLSNSIFEDLYNKIKSNYYSVGDLLPTEEELQKIYGVSRAPIRAAMSKLKNEGFIYRKPGIGTIIAENTVFSPWSPMGGFSSQFRTHEGELVCNTIDVSKTIVNKEITEQLKVREDDPIIQVIRVRKENNSPIFLLKHYYPDTVNMKKIKEAGDILYMRQFASHVLGINFEYVTEELTAVSADHQQSYLLETNPGEPLLKIKRTSFDSDYKPVEYVEYFVKSHHWPYKVIFSKEGGPFEN
ncbi:GntR family transcriptional regulator [Lentibacillus halodurans]|uniref:GntR family transcriptional regulator n=1 Tax=Lentibacillus halodurans TaxID=237679 RepID=A0A1I0WZ65_9BACI|nr:GntR family transcriptional regulator [Lentibacillus halodurans]SFA93931.1 GntR family transcriptional regulator [Lentibacillus halodurans]